MVRKKQSKHGTEGLVNRMDKDKILSILETAKDKNGEVPMKLVRQAFDKLQEPIQCKNCKWWGYDDDNGAVRVCHAAKHGHMSSNWSIMIYRTHKGDFYCADAERRIDE